MKQLLYKLPVGGEDLTTDVSIVNCYQAFVPGALFKNEVSPTEPTSKFQVPTSIIFVTCDIDCYIKKGSDNTVSLSSVPADSETAINENVIPIKAGIEKAILIQRGWYITYVSAADTGTLEITIPQYEIK